MKILQNQLQLFFLIIFISFHNNANAQNFNSYTNIRSSGKIPQDFLISASSGFEADKSQIGNNEKSFEKRSKKSFYLESNFMVNELLHNGKVLYNDPLGIYVNKVLNTLLVNKPELRKQIRVYVVLSDIVNAYATDKGIIFINTGLLAKLENEAQLAFILGHEITHYEQKHVLNRYVLNDKIVKGKISYSNSEVESLLFLKTSYDKQQEIDSDNESTKKLLQTAYNPNAGMQVMRLLSTDIPFRSKYNFDTSFFKIDSIAFHFKAVNYADLTYEEDLETDSKTHPALSQRIDLIKGLIDSVASSKKPYFILPESEFMTMQKTARYELAKIYLQKGRCIYALYTIYQLLQENPESIYLKSLLCKTYYQTAKFSEEFSTRMNGFDAFNEPKEIQYLYKYYDQFESADLNALAALSFAKNFPDSTLVRSEIRLRDLLYTYKKEYDESETVYSEAAYRYLKSIPSINKYITKVSVVDDSAETKKKKKKKDRTKINNIIIVDPVYKKFDLRKKTQERYIASEKSLMEYGEQINSLTDQLSIQDTIISSLGWTQNDTIAFYNHSLFKNHIDEIFNNGTGIVSTNFEKVDTACATYQSSHLALMGTYSFHTQKDVITKIIVLTWSAFLFPTLPLGIYYVCTPSYKTYTYLLTINSKNQGIDYKNVRMMKFKDSKGAINSSTYYQLLKMQTGK